MEKEKLIKTRVFLGLTFLASLFLGRVVSFFSTSTFFEFWEKSLAFCFKVSFSFILAGIFFCLPALFLKKQKMFTAILFNCFGFLLGFLVFSSWQNLTAAVFFILLFFLAQHSFFKDVQKQSEKFLSFSPADIFPLPLRNFFSILSLICCLGFFLSLQREVIHDEFVIPEPFLEKIMTPINQIFNQSFERGLKNQMGDKFEGVINNKMAEEASTSLLPTPSELKAQLEKQIKPFLKYLPFLGILSLFFTLRFIIGFLIDFLTLIVPLMFKILLSLRVFKIVEKQKTVKRITY
ncbi:hypothetical protein ISS85_03730 [Candidatus Microgenomates bacterium]|nr:hypothetical protein [Candidatus Microgenomates bacterium]